MIAIRNVGMQIPVRYLDIIVSSRSLRLGRR
jgi:hypothetical protein